MNSVKNLPQRKSPRLKNFNYQARNIFFITLCTHQRRLYFGSINGGEMRPSSVGILTRDMWLRLPRHVPGLELLDFVLMPNHLHAIIITPGRSDGQPECFGKPRSGSLPTIMRNYKAAVTREVRLTYRVKQLWQRGFYEHVVRDEKDYLRIAEYIAQNPLKWHVDRLYQE
ncbi:MAG: transposase [Pseudomonadaceae bacterium]|nr:MAG: transposase [Pseudomonadaceae bacterium]